jgi:hypothetical protein
MSNTPSFWEDFFDGSDYYTSPPLTDTMVADVERALGYTLPASYLRLLLVKNGGAPKRQCHPTGGTHWSDNHVRVTSVFGIGGRWGIDSEEFGTRHMIQTAGFPEVGIIVGWTPTAGHDAVMLDYSARGPQGEPRVIHIDAESGESEVLAATFEAFLRGLVDCRPYEEQRERELEEFRRRSQHP